MALFVTTPTAAHDASWTSPASSAPPHCTTDSQSWVKNAKDPSRWSDVATSVTFGVIATVLAIVTIVYGKKIYMIMYPAPGQDDPPESSQTRDIEIGMPADVNANTGDSSPQTAANQDGPHEAGLGA